MGCIKKHLLLITLLILVVKPLNAQLFKRPDSVSVWSAFSVGIGGYYGINQYKPQTEGLIYFNQSGYDQGIIGRLQLNLTPCWSLGIDYRYIQRTAFINMEVPSIMRDQFMLSTTGHQWQLIAAYRLNAIQKKSEIVTIYSGASWNRFLLQAFPNSNKYDFLLPASTAVDVSNGGEYYLFGSVQTYYSFIGGVSKDFQLAGRFLLTPFFEFEGKRKALTVPNGFSYINGPYVSYDVQYNQSNYKLGLFFYY